ncbi:MAG: hypothetical protein V4736_16010 [Bdellovibrionota bacterium]
MKLNSYITIAIVAINLMGCDQKKKLDNMHDATLEMRDTTKGVEKTSNRMSEQVGEQLEVSGEMNAGLKEQLAVSGEMNSGLKEQLAVSGEMNKGLIEQLAVSREMNEGLKKQLDVSYELKDSTNELYDALRQGDALQLRREAWDRIINTPDLVRKVSESGKYFMSYEFQLWTGAGKDGGEGSVESQKEKREILFQQAVREFFLDIQEFYVPGEIKPLGGQNKLFGMDKGDGEQKHANFNAIAIALDQTNRKQIIAAKALGLPEKSMYSLIQDALTERAQPSEKARVSGTTYIEEVLLQEAIAWQLIQARHNILNLVILCQLTDVKNPVAFARKLALRWDLDISKLNSSQKKLLAGYIGMMQESISFLGKNKQPIRVDGKLVKLWKNMNIVNSSGKEAATLALVGQITSYKAWLSKAYP